MQVEGRIPCSILAYEAQRLIEEFEQKEWKPALLSKDKTAWLVYVLYFIDDLLQKHYQA